MAFTLVCHVCGHKLKLFDSSIKKRKGMIRCPHCSARISYDLDSRKIQKSGFWAAEEPAFDYRTKNKMLSQLERDKNRKNPSVPQEQEPFGMNPFQSRASFAEFDLKTDKFMGSRLHRSASGIYVICKKNFLPFNRCSFIHMKYTAHIFITLLFCKK